MKTSLKAAVALALVCAAGFVSAAEFAANVAYTTDYRFRGVSMSDRSQAIQGGFDLSAENGVYFGTWTSSIAFASLTEVDYYAGWSAELNEDMAIDVGVRYYNYPKDNSNPDFDFVELYASVAFGDATLGLAYSPDYCAESDTFYYLYGDYSFAMGEQLTLDLHLGYNAFDNDAAFANYIGPASGEDPGDDYLDYSIGVSTSQLGLVWSLQFIGTDIDKDECFGGTKLCGGSAVLSVSKSF